MLWHDTQGEYCKLLFMFVFVTEICVVLCCVISRLLQQSDIIKDLCPTYFLNSQ